MTLITPPDVEHWLTGYLRPLLSDVPDLEIGNKHPPEYDGTHPTIIINDVPGNRQDPLSFDWSIGVTVTGWSRQDDKPCKDLANKVFAILTQHPQIALANGSPISAVVDEGSTPPAVVTSDADAASYYATVEYVVQGEF